MLASLLKYKYYLPEMRKYLVDFSINLLKGNEYYSAISHNLPYLYSYHNSNYGYNLWIKKWNRNLFGVFLCEDGYDAYYRSSYRTMYGANDLLRSASYNLDLIFRPGDLTQVSTYSFISFYQEGSEWKTIY